MILFYFSENKIVLVYKLKLLDKITTGEKNTRVSIKFMQL